MAELGILWVIMAVTIAVAGGLVLIFRGWMSRRDDLDRE